MEMIELARRGRPPKGEVMTYDQMIEEQRQTRNTRIYRGRADNLSASAEAIQKSVGVALAELRTYNNAKRIVLEQTDRVKDIAEQYLQACCVTSYLPKISGLAHALGYSYKGLNAFMNLHPSHPTTEFLHTFRDLCSDILSENALVGAVNPIMAIFTQKAIYGLRDNITVETVPVDDGAERLTQGEIEKKYGDLIEQEAEKDNG